jgi:Na+-transporting NADH:ubiquinone oxidoreductase subunit F
MNSSDRTYAEDSWSRAPSTLMRFIRTLHKWTGLIAGVQMCLWLLSGLVMSLLDHHVVSGDSTAASAPAVEPPPASAPFVEPTTLLRRHATESVLEVLLQSHAGQWVWRVHTDERTLLYDALSGAPVEITEAKARLIAAQGYSGKGAITSVSLLHEPTVEAREHEAPLRRVDFNDSQHTRYYISIDDGRIVERRTDDWRVFDFFWMLHTMDYRSRDDFNNPLVISFAFASVWLALTGVLLLFRSFGARADRNHTAVD